MLGSGEGHFGPFSPDRFPPPPPGSPSTSSSGSSSRTVAARCGSRASGGGYCHDFRRGWLSCPFGRCSAVVVTVLLATTDPFSCICWFCLIGCTCVLFS